MDNTTYQCEPGAVLDGGSTTRHAFHGNANNVTIQGCEIRNYNNPAQWGAIDSRGSTGWTVIGNEIHHNWGVGVQLKGSNHSIVGNNIHHQHQLGLAVDGVNHLVEDNEIAFNNWEVDYNWGWEAGGTKFWDTDGLIVRGNWSHDNHGPGLWDDYNNINVLYEDNVVEDNYGPGIFHEISYRATIRNNTVRRNGFGHAAWLWGAGILIAASQDTDVYGNVVEGNHNGVTLVNQDRYDPPTGQYRMKYGDYATINNAVYGNTIRGSGVTGGATDNGFNEMFAAGVNVFSGNTYEGVNSWMWAGSSRSWAGWLGYHAADGG